MEEAVQGAGGKYEALREEFNTTQELVQVMVKKVLEGI